MPQSLVLASASARRRWLLESAGIQFTVEPSDIEEIVENGETPLAFSTRMAKEKASDVARRRADTGRSCWILGADTIVVHGEQILGKPNGRADARRILNLLSGDTHEVITAFCLLGPGGDGPGVAIERNNVTQVNFRKLGASEIERYLDEAEWADKAGGYAVQEHAAGMVRSISGSYTNVVGLPLAETIECLREAGAVPEVPEP
jgi:septum formation protein